MRATHRCLASLSHRYNETLLRINGREDPVQRKVIEKLESLRGLVAHHNWPIPRHSDYYVASKVPTFIARRLADWRSPKGLYLVGSVGTGKTMLLDLFVRTLAEEDGVVIVSESDFDVRERPAKRQRACLRTHFHEFMLNVHQRLHHVRQSGHPTLDPLRVVAADIAGETPLICFDEFQVTKIDCFLLYDI